MKFLYSLAAVLPTVMANFYGYTAPGCRGNVVLIDNMVCNGCVKIPITPRFLSYRGIDMIGVNLGSEGTCDRFNMGWHRAGECIEDSNAAAARAYINCAV